MYSVHTPWTYFKGGVLCRSWNAPLRVALQSLLMQRNTSALSVLKCTPVGVEVVLTMARGSLGTSFSSKHHQSQILFLIADPCGYGLVYEETCDRLSRAPREAGVAVPV